MPSRPLLLLLLPLLFSGPLIARVQVTLPLEGHYRPGRYMPLRVRASLPGDSAFLQLAADGCVQTHVQPSHGRIETTVPFLVVESPGPLRWQVRLEQQTLALPPLRALEPHERLVGLCGGDVALAAELFPGRTILPVMLDRSDPLPGTPANWETLDAVVLDAAAAQRVPAETWAALAAAGTLLAVNAELPPELRWPWTRRGGYWVLHQTPLGPGQDLIAPQVYRPVDRWVGAWPDATRWRFVLLGLAFCILLLGTHLLRGRVLIVVALAVCALSAGGIGAWIYIRSPLLHRGGEILVLPAREEGWVQVDRWFYQSAVAWTATDMPWREGLRPVFTSRGHMQNMVMSLVCQADGRPGYFWYRLPTGTRIAFLSRTVGPKAPSLPPGPAQPTPLAELARDSYSPARVVGQFPSVPLQKHSSLGFSWPTVVVQPAP